MRALLLLVYLYHSCYFTGIGVILRSLIFSMQDLTSGQTYSYNHWIIRKIAQLTDRGRTTHVCIDNIAIFRTNAGIYIIINKNIRYLLWNRGAWRFFHDTYLTIEVRGIRCTHHLHDSCPLTDVNPHFTAPGYQYYLNINSCWSIVTSSTHGPAASHCDVTMIHCSHGYLWTHDVEVDAS